MLVKLTIIGICLILLSVYLFQEWIISETITTIFKYCDFTFCWSQLKTMICWCLDDVPMTKEANISLRPYLNITYARNE